MVVHCAGGTVAEFESVLAGFRSVGGGGVGWFSAAVRWAFHASEGALPLHQFLLKENCYSNTFDTKLSFGIKCIVIELLIEQQ